MVTIMSLSINGGGTRRFLVTDAVPLEASRRTGTLIQAVAIGVTVKGLSVWYCTVHSAVVATRGRGAIVSGTYGLGGVTTHLFSIRVYRGRLLNSTSPGSGRTNQPRG